MIDLEDLQKKCQEFDKLEKRDSFYTMSKNLLNQGLEIEAYTLMLATWNFARYRYYVNNFDINSFNKKIKTEWNPMFYELKDEKLQKADFDKIGSTVKQLYSSMSKIKGIEYTGASKIMHLKVPELFVMWDTQIRVEYKVKTSAEDYIEFHKKMQKLVHNIKWKNKLKTLAKAIDEYNYMKYTYL